MARSIPSLRSPGDQEWEDQRGVLGDLYKEHTMHYVMEYMRERYGWDAR